MMESISTCLEKQSFIQNIFEKGPFLFANAFDSRDYTWDKLTDDFFGVSPISTDVRIYHDSLADKTEYLVGRQEGDNSRFDYRPEAFAAMLDAGATIVINSFDRHSVFAANLRSDISIVTGEHIVGNAYISKGSSTTFGLHWDRHCVFAAQVIGKKRWTVYKPTFELPLQHQISADYKKECPPSEIVLEAVLNQGDILYLPRGWWHEAETISKHPSFHIAYGVHTNRIYDYMRWILQKKMANYLQARQSFGRSPHADNFMIDEALRIFESECSMNENKAAFRAERKKLSTSNQPMNFRKIMGVFDE